MRTVRIRTEKPYDVIIGKGLISNLGYYISDVLSPLCRKLFIITDDTVDALYGDCAEKSLASLEMQIERFVFPHGEGSKTLATSENAINHAVRFGLTRNDTVIALGGGVAGDIAGFVSSVYMRGVDFVTVPTTLLAAVDASVGGKTGVDLGCGKNLIGTFHQPRKVICDTDIISSLPKNIYNDGLGEVIKHGIIGNDKILGLIDTGNTEELIALNVEEKASIVETDTEDRSLRHLLNFGHTYGHALEVLFNYKMPHGLAVGIGMTEEAKLFEKLGLKENGFSEKIKSVCEKYGLYKEIKPSKELIDIMMTDKKNINGGIVFTVPKGNNELIQVCLSKEDMLSIIQ